MTQNKPAEHPLFDSTSTYSRLREGAGPEYKRRGYFYWQKARAIRLGIPPRNGDESRQIDLCDLASRIVGKDAPDLRVTDALDIRPVCLGGGPRFGESTAGSLVLVREAEGTRTMGMWLELDGRESSQPGSCRAFLIEPEVLARLQDVVQKACHIGPDNALDHAFAAETVAGNLDIARLLSAIPDLDGEVHGAKIRFHRLPIADEFETFPPRQGPLTVVLVFDEPAAPAPAQ
jgi:hypothetical protein